MLYISLRQYEYLIAAVEFRSLTKASEKLNVSQPSLTNAITKIENTLGQKVFQRKRGAQIEITPFGHSVARKAKMLVGDAARIEGLAQQNRPIVLGCFADISPWYLVPALKRLTQCFPDVQFQGKEGRFNDLESGLADGQFDLVISYDVTQRARLRCIGLHKVLPVVFVSPEHPMAKNENVSLEQVAKEPLILFEESQSESFFHQLFDSLRLRPEIVQRVSSLELMRSFAANGAGVGLSYSRPENKRSYDGSPIVTVPISTPTAAAQIGLFWSQYAQPAERYAEFAKALEQTSDWLNQDHKKKALS